MKPPERKTIFESKYAVPRRMRHNLLAVLRHYALVPRHFPYAKLETNYFDDANASSFYESRDGQLHKKKYRFREYLNPDKNGALYSLEIKIRADTQTSKAKELIYKKLPREYKFSTFRHLVDTFEELHGHPFFSLRAELPGTELFPSTKICYERCRFDDRHCDVRYNLDTNVMVYPCSWASTKESNGFYLEHDIFEIKSDHPDFFPAFLKTRGLRRISFSKFIWGKEFVTH